MEENNRTLMVKHYTQRKSKSWTIEEILTMLSIPFKKISSWNKTRSFWLVNEADLEYIYNDFCKEIRYALRDFHPQNGGDPIEFSKLVKSVDRIKKQFWAFGIGKNLSLYYAFAAEEQRAREQEIRGPIKQKRIVSRPDTRISFEERIKKVPERFCQTCGKKLIRRESARLETFSQFCARRFCGYQCSAKAQWDNKCSDETRALISQKLKGRVFSESHRAALSQALKGRVFSEAHKQALRKPKANKHE